MINIIMRAFLFLMVMLVSTFAQANTETILIRRAHIELTGVVPSIAEMEWYQVYNRNPYNTAVDELLKRKDLSTHKSKKLLKEWLMSDEFKKNPPQPFDITPSLFFVVGMQYTACVTHQDVLMAKKQLIEHAKTTAYSRDDIVDYMCNSLLCRNSNLAEANALAHRFNTVDALFGEDAAYMSVLEDILQLPDCKLK